MNEAPGFCMHGVKSAEFALTQHQQHQLAIILARIKNQVPDQVPDWAVITDRDMERFNDK